MQNKELSDPFCSLDQRARDIFKQIVENYLQDGEPIGSQSLAKALPHNISSATIRNVMGHLETLGLIFSPHISAGRLPTEKGLRFFVDSFMEVGALKKEEKKIIEKQIQTVDLQQSVDDLLQKAGHILSDLSRGAGIVVTNKNNPKIEHIEFLRLNENQALVVLVSDKKEVENRIIPLPLGITEAQLTQANNYLNWHIRHKSLHDVKKAIIALRAEAQAALDQLSQQLIDTGLAFWSGEEHSSKTQLVVRGRSNLLENIKAREDLERIRLLFDDLETHDTVTELLELAEEGEGVRIFIGSENKLFSLSGSSLIVAPYHDSEQKIVGVLGVIGPTRLNYARIVPMVDYTAHLISTLLP